VVTTSPEAGESHNADGYVVMLTVTDADGSDRENLTGA
jgi:hypothetical protein